MKQALTGLTLAVALALAVPAYSHEVSKGAQAITGEIVDTGCFLAHMGQGAKHVECATKCISGGMPMGVLTRQGTLYLVTMNHDNADSYNKLKSMAGKKLTVMGQIYSRGGMKAIEIIGFRPARA